MRWPWSSSCEVSSRVATGGSTPHRYRSDAGPVRGGAKPNRTGAKAIPGRQPTDLQWHPPREHAELLLRSLQRPDGRTGWVAAPELRDIHRELMIDVQWEPMAWDAVGRELRKLLRQPKTYVWRNGKKSRAYYIVPVARTESVSIPGHEMRRAS